MNVNNRYINQSKAYEMLKHEADTFIQPAVKEAYERAARLIDMLDSEDVTLARHGKCDNTLCTNCGTYVDYFISGEDYYLDDDPEYCPYCGAFLQG